MPSNRERICRPSGIVGIVDYRPRIVDAALDALLEGLPALSLEGAKVVGKTETALRRARTVHRLDDPGRLEIVRAAPARHSRPAIRPS